MVKKKIKEKYNSYSSCGLLFQNTLHFPNYTQFLISLYFYSKYLFQFIGLRLILISVCILTVGQAQTPYRQDAIHIIPDPGILLLRAGWKQASHWILQNKEK